MVSLKDTRTGMAWVAMKDDRVVDVIYMKVPNDVDFKEHRKEALSLLSQRGVVKSGFVVFMGGEKRFILRQNHERRGRVKKEKKLYSMKGL